MKQKTKFQNSKKRKFFFVRDHKNRYRYFSSEPVKQIKVRFHRWEKIWELAKQKLMLLPPRVLRQEQAFSNSLFSKETKIKIYFSELTGNEKVKTKFRFFLRKQKTKHIFFLAGEILLLPLSGLAALLPGPNVFFGVLALIMISHWQGFRGINNLLKKEYEFFPSSLLTEWETSLKKDNENHLFRILEKIEKEYNLPGVQKILWK